MPYVKPERRDCIYFKNENNSDHCIDVGEIESVGELNYAITMLCLDFLEKDGRAYRSFNEIIGVLECAKQEFYRRAVVPYENEKVEENGDVY